MKRSEERTREAKRRIFEQIEALMDTHDMTQITFGKIARRLGCQPNSVAYYFNSKMDMLQQFTQEHMHTADTVYLPILRQGIETLPPVERFCREIDCILAASGQKSKPHLLNNFFLITNAPLRSEFSLDLQQKIHLDLENNRRRLESYASFGILEESRFHDAFVELVYYDSAFSLTQIFHFPTWAQEDLLHNTKERLKAAFLRDGLYTPQYRPVVLPEDFPCADPAAAAERYNIPDEDIPALKLEVFRHINRLLKEDRPDDITFARLGELCYCQPSGIAYYFKNKEDMILQAIVWASEQRERTVNRDISALPPECWTLSSLCRLVHELCFDSLSRNRWVFWVNYLILSNLNNPDYLAYLSFHVKRNTDYTRSVFRRFAEEPFVRADQMEYVFSEMCFFGNGMVIHDLFRTPLIEPEHLLRLSARRFLSLLVKPDRLEEAFACLDALL